MIKRWWTQFVNNRVADVIEKAAASERYSKYQYLCVAIGLRSKNPFKRMAVRNIKDNLRGAPTLCYAIIRALGEEGYSSVEQSWFRNIDWSEQIVIKRAYWTKVVSEMRKGNLTWGKYFNTKEIQADPPHLRDSYKPDEVTQ